ncbi:MAG TPA: M48 family metallopeptidase [Candidatus Paceibacterota bacterium]
MAITYDLKRSLRARRVRISVYPDSRVVVTIPRLFSVRSAERFLAKQARWIEHSLAQTRGKKVIPLARADIPVLKKRAAALAAARCTYFAKMYGVRFKKISICAQKSRWGSCSRSGALSFNYKIAALPEHIADYIIVHELCHLSEMNHSKKFWHLVAREVPEHRAIRKELRNTVIMFR